MRGCNFFVLFLFFSVSSVFSADAVRGDLHCVGDAGVSDMAVSFGIPFLQGELRATGGVSLRTSDGHRLASDCWPLAFWPDGSVKWEGVATVVPKGCEGLHFSTVSADGLAENMPSEPVEITYFEERIVVRAGDLCAYVPGSGDCLMDSLSLCGKVVAGAAVLHCSTQDSPSVEDVSTLHSDKYVGRVEKVCVERAGGVRAVVRIDGRYVGENGRAWLPFTVRLYFFAGADRVKMVHSFVFDGDADVDFINGLGVSFDVPLRESLYNRHVAFATGGGGVWAEPVQPLVGRRVLTLDGDKGWQERQMRGERIPEREVFDSKNQHLLDSWACWDGFRLNQTSSDGFTIRKRTRSDRPWIGTFSGSRASGYAFVGDVSGGLGVGVKDFWQSYPAALQVTGAAGSSARLTAWLWSPEAAPMDLRHYDVTAHDLEASYEDVQEGMSTPYGVARTHVLTLVPASGYAGKEEVAVTAAALEGDAVWVCTPEYLHRKHAFGVWSLPKRETSAQGRVEDRLNDFLDYYIAAVDAHKWYGFWNYGDFMHTYDAVRHTWKYDVGGYAWDNTELASNMWLWYSFLRTGREDIFRLAVAMSRHTAECDVYHAGPFAGLGSRHNVTHWGCGAKEARISQAAWNRFLYYLTADERSGDLMSEVKDAEQMLYDIDPMRLALPRSEYPCSAPARLRIGPDWLAYVGNWMTEWERTGDTRYRDRIIAGMRSIAALPNGIFTGPGVLGFDPATGVLSYEGDPDLQHTNHLLSIMGGFQVMIELLEMVDVACWNDVWISYALDYRNKARELSHSKFPVTRLMAYAAAATGDEELARAAWDELWHVWNNDRPFVVNRVDVPEVPVAVDENPWICTNDAATWSLAAIYMQEVIPQP